MTSEEIASEQALGHETVLLAAFEGWNDAGSAASTAIRHLIDVWGAEQIDELDPEDYHDFQVNRPMTASDEDGNRTVMWPTTTIHTAIHPVTERKVLMVVGIEPSIRWRSYCTEILDIAEQYGVTTVVTLGALLADVPHTRPIPVTATSSDVGLQALFTVEESTYEGPTGIVGILQHLAPEHSMRGLSLWAAVPHYVAHPPSPKAALALLGRIEQVLAAPIPNGQLTEDAQAWQQGVDELAAEDSEISEYVTQLEEATDTVELPEASGEAIAREFEKYLRRRDKGPGN